ncbi:MAG: DUF3817 domain-containing protein [Cryobacterium sp.]|nr:DUF3817 domain-containing protein [Cryobacterium sp.]
MTAGPRPIDIPRIRTTLIAYKISAMITGIFLLLLVVMMVFRYGLGADIEIGGANGLVALTPPEAITAVNGSTIILIVHGWLYVAYLACDFLLWRLVRFSFARFLLIALGGVVPFLSFFFEVTVPKFVNEEIDRVAITAATSAASGAPVSPADGTPTT